MRLLLYLRRSLVGLRAGVGGPLFRDDLSKTDPAVAGWWPWIITRKTALAFPFLPSGSADDPGNNAPQISGNSIIRESLGVIPFEFCGVNVSNHDESLFVENLLNSHRSILSVGDRERNRPLLPVLAGGNA